MYLAWKKDVKVNLRESVVMQLSEKVKGSSCTLFIGNSPAMINEIYTIGMIQTNIKQMSKLKEDKKMSWGENI